MRVCVPSLDQTNMARSSINNPYRRFRPAPISASESQNEGVISPPFYPLQTPELYLCCLAWLLFGTQRDDEQANSSLRDAHAAKHVPIYSIPCTQVCLLLIRSLTHLIIWIMSEFCPTQHPSYRLHCHSRVLCCSFYVPCLQPPQPYL